MTGHAPSAVFSSLLAVGCILAGTASALADDGYSTALGVTVGEMGQPTSLAAANQPTVTPAAPHGARRSTRGARQPTPSATTSTRSARPTTRSARRPTPSARCNTQCPCAPVPGRQHEMSLPGHAVPADHHAVPATDTQCPADQHPVPGRQHAGARLLTRSARPA